jgi:2-polyprenyl-6-methoxyphenol hydroxylase-like FAD-dependent oxidoreductase
MNSHAVVIGGGIGGLLAAHALVGRFERVTILERDGYPADSGTQAPPARRGAPQSRCLHLLTAGGAAAFDQLIPGWREELVALGAVPFDASADTACQVASGWLPRTFSGITAYAGSRPLLEHVLRSGLARHREVRVLEGRRVVGLLGSAAGERLVGVRTAAPHASAEATLLTDLVVDASGSGSMLPGWLHGMAGRFAAPVEEVVVESPMRYVSRWYALDAQDAPDWHCLSVAPSPPGPRRGAMMLRAEHNRWGVVLLAEAGDPLPSDDRSFLAFAAGLGEGRLRDVLVRASPLSPIHRYGIPSNRMRRYDRRTPWPLGLVALGDAVCMLDPYFGFGMTMAARGAVLLRNRTQQNGVRATWCLDFQRDLVRQTEEPWRIATGHDTDGRTLTRDKTRLARLYELAPSSPEVAHALIAVQHLLRPMDTLMECELT